MRKEKERKIIHRKQENWTFVFESEGQKINIYFALSVSLPFCFDLCKIRPVLAFVMQF
jgi:hypothetical protein